MEAESRHLIPATQGAQFAAAATATAAGATVRTKLKGERQTRAHPRILSRCLVGESMKPFTAALAFLIAGFGICAAQITPPSPDSGVLAAFSNGTGFNQNNAQFSPDGANLAGGSTQYQGCSPVTAMMPFAGGVLTAFSNVGCNPSLYRVHFSPDGNALGSGAIRYQGCSPVTGMMPFAGGVLTAFSNVGCNPSLYRVQFSPDGNSLGSGAVRYQGCSPVTAMIPFGGGVLTAFSSVGCNPNLYRVQFSPDGNNLGSGAITYQGPSPVTAMLEFDGGVLVAFTNVPDESGRPVLNRVRFSPDGNNLASGPVVYEGTAKVTAMIPFAGGVLTVFTRVPDDNGNPVLNRVQFSADGNNLQSGPIVYEGTTPVTAIIPFAFFPSDTFSDTSIDSAKWEISRPLASSTVSENDGLLLTSDGTAGRFPDTPGLFGPGAGISSRCKLSGDFDIQVDYSGFLGAGPGFTQAFFNIYQDANDQLLIKRIAGASANGIQTSSRFNGVLYSGPVTPFGGISGGLRITRSSGGGLTTFADMGGGFVQQFSGPSLFSGDVSVSLMLLGPAGRSSSVVFQDFRVNSAGAIQCEPEIKSAVGRR